MKSAYSFKDDKSDKFWWIDYSGNSFVVNYGKNGATGKYEVKEFDTEEECKKEAQKLISQKLKKGYIQNNNFDFINRFYFDDEEIGLHPKTSHPYFANHFKDEIYYDCCDEETPFGSDNGNDALHELEEHMRKYGNTDIALLPKKIIEEFWEMEYLQPDNLDEKSIKELLNDKNQDYSITIPQSDQVTIAIAFGIIKVSGKIDADFKNTAIRSLKRFSITAKLLEWGESAILEKLTTELNSYNPI